MKPHHWMLCLTLAACVADETTPTTPNDPNDPQDPVDPSTLTPDSFVERLVTSDCQKAFACKAEYPATSAETFEDAFGTSEATCVSDDDDVADGDAIVQAVAAGRITFDPTLAASCLDNLGVPASCTEFFTTYDWPDSCYDALVGNVVDGAACASDWECGPDSECAEGTAVCTLTPDDE